MKKIILILFWFTTLNSVISQTIYNPSINRQEENRITIDKIENTDKNTIVHFTYTASNEYLNGGWITINPDIIIKETSGDRKYKLIKSEGMPLSPNKHSFSFNDEKLRFKLYFPKIDDKIRNIDIIENENNKFFFNFFGVSLSKSNVRNGSEVDFIDEYVKYLPSEIKSIFMSTAFVDSRETSLPKYFDGLIEKLNKEKFININKIEIGENDTSQTYTFILNNKVNPMIEFFFRYDSKLNGGIDYIRFHFTNEKEAYSFYKGFVNFFGYSSSDKDDKNKNGFLISFKMFLLPSNIYYSPVRLIKYSENYFGVEIIVTDKSPNK